MRNRVKSQIKVRAPKCKSGIDRNRTRKRLSKMLLVVWSTSVRDVYILYKYRIHMEN